MWKRLWNCITGRGWNSLEGSEEGRKMWKSLELPRDFLSSFDKSADSDINNKTEVVSDGDEELIGNWNKSDSCYVLAKRLEAFCPCPRDLWNFELERDGLGYLVEEISKQQSSQEVILKPFGFIREGKHTSSENWQPDNEIEKKILFSEEKYKPAAEICISNEEPNVNGGNVSRTCQRSSQQPFPSQALRHRRKKWFHGQVLGSPCCAAPRELVPCVPATPAMAERGQCRAWAMASEGAVPKLWQLPHGIEPASAQKSRIEVWEPPPRFQRMYGNACVPRQKFAAEVGPSWRTSARSVQKGNVGQSPHTESLLGRGLVEL
ncbi:uncharacterized protein LOC124901689 [Homo sapiens]|uniref:uncharacterized protein LOC124901689 n=1 Tax=Homo sapiens TaxID=9606 RepID=UPI001FB10296|nr:uncharacterized protein LOC124901689 [Homo sapiens]XP_047300929.1 uncharacterized protein LOC124901689 [Homo sapiens]